MSFDQPHIDRIDDLLNISSPTEMDTLIQKNTSNILKVFQHFKTALYDINSPPRTREEIKTIIHCLKFIDTWNLFMPDKSIHTLLGYMSDIKSLVSTSNDMQHETKDSIIKQIRYTVMTVITYKKSIFENWFFAEDNSWSKEIEYGWELVTKNGKFEHGWFKQLQNLFYVVQGRIEDGKKNELQQKWKDMKALSIKYKNQRKNIINNSSTPNKVQGGGTVFDDTNDGSAMIGEYSDYKNYSNANGELYDYNDHFYANNHYYEDKEYGSTRCIGYQDKYYNTNSGNHWYPYRSGGGGHYVKYYENEEKDIYNNSTTNNNNNYYYQESKERHKEISEGKRNCNSQGQHEENNINNNNNIDTNEQSQQNINSDGIEIVQSIVPHRRGYYKKKYSNQGGRKMTASPYHVAKNTNNNNINLPSSNESPEPANNDNNLNCKSNSSKQVTEKNNVNNNNINSNNNSNINNINNNNNNDNEIQIINQTQFNKGYTSGFKKKMKIIKNPKQRGATLIEVPFPWKEGGQGHEISSSPQKDSNTKEKNEKGEISHQQTINDAEIIQTVAGTKPHGKYGFKSNQIGKGPYHSANVNASTGYYQHWRDNHYHKYPYYPNKQTSIPDPPSQQGNVETIQGSLYYTKRTNQWSGKKYNQYGKQKYDFVEIGNNATSNTNYIPWVKHSATAIEVPEPVRRGTDDNDNHGESKNISENLNVNDLYECENQDTIISKISIKKEKEIIKDDISADDKIDYQDERQSQEKEIKTESLTFNNIKTYNDNILQEQIPQSHQWDNIDYIVDNTNQRNEMDWNANENDIKDEINSLDFQQQFILSPLDENDNIQGQKENRNLDENNINSDNNEDIWKVEPPLLSHNPEDNRIFENGEHEELSDSEGNEVMGEEFRKFLQENQIIDRKNKDIYCLIPEERNNTFKKDDDVIFSDNENLRPEIGSPEEEQQYMNWDEDNQEKHIQELLNEDNTNMNSLIEKANREAELELLKEQEKFINQEIENGINAQEEDIKVYIMNKNEELSTPTGNQENTTNNHQLKKQKLSTDNTQKWKTQSEVTSSPQGQTQQHIGKFFTESLKTVDPKIITAMRDKIKKNYNIKEKETKKASNYVLISTSFPNGNTQIFNPIFLSMIQMFHKHCATNKIPFQPFNINNYLQFVQLGRDSTIFREYLQLKVYQLETPNYIWTNIQSFENRILIPLYQRINYNSNKKREFYFNTFNRYKDLIKSTIQDNIQFTVIPYGSIMNNFLIDYGDIDICIIPNCNILDFAPYLQQIKGEIISRKYGGHILSHQTSKYMLWKIVDNQSKYNIDITVHTMLPIWNTNLVRWYSWYDQRFHIVGLYIKHWAKINKIHGATDNYLSSYALIWMLIHFLQNIIEPRILPNLQRIDESKRTPFKYYYNNELVETNIYYEEDLKKIKPYMNRINNGTENQEIATNILIKFFEYYSYYFDQNQKIAINKPTSEWMKDKADDIAFSIEDPFDLHHNPGRSMTVDSEQFTQFVMAMKKEVNFILNGEYVKRWDKGVNGSNGNTWNNMNINSN